MLTEHRGDAPRYYALAQRYGITIMDEWIEELEKTRRGLYGGVLGYLDFAGNADFAIAIRTALMRNGTAYVQAGGGVVADSNGPYEYNEAANKARAVLNAIAAAGTLTEP